MHIPAAEENQNSIEGEGRDEKDSKRHIDGPVRAGLSKHARQRRTGGEPCDVH